MNSNLLHYPYEEKTLASFDPPIGTTIYYVQSGNKKSPTLVTPEQCTVHSSWNIHNKRSVLRNNDFPVFSSLGNSLISLPKIIIIIIIIIIIKTYRALVSDIVILCAVQCKVEIKNAGRQLLKS